MYKTGVESISSNFVMEQEHVCIVFLLKSSHGILILVELMHMNKDRTVLQNHFLIFLFKSYLVNFHGGTIKKYRKSTSYYIIHKVLTGNSDKGGKNRNQW